MYNVTFKKTQAETTLNNPDTLPSYKYDLYRHMVIRYVHTNESKSGFALSIINYKSYL